MQSLNSKISKKRCNFAPKLKKMTTLYIFNPEHDLALASNLKNFTSPHAGRKLRADLGFLPALWAGEDDLILVDNVDQAVKAYGRLRAKTGNGPRHFIDKNQLAHNNINKVEPWGWDPALQSFLLRYGVENVPSEETIAVIRDLSHRKQAVSLLRELQMSGTTGYSLCVNNLDEVFNMLSEYGCIVVKAPWSSSGRGVRFIDGEINDSQQRWVQNIIEKQGSVVLEPYYHKVKDFGMEFESDGKGQIKYLGLSLFHTKNGAYTGNLIASEEEKEKILSNYISVDILRNVREMICNILGALYADKYQGPFGIDMMVVATDKKDGFLLHPCVEINLRRTMGHVALSIPPFADGYARVMQIILTDKYRIRVRKP